jgi:hypothetical protein
MHPTISQKQAVVNAISKVLGSSFISGSTAVKSILTSDQLKQVRTLVFDGIKNGDVQINKSYDDSGLQRYVNGMVDNHLRKAKELNGGTSYRPSSTRASKNVKDPQLSALKKLASSYSSGNPELTKVQAAIMARETELGIARASNVTSKKNTPALDEELMAIIEE